MTEMHESEQLVRMRTMLRSEIQLAQSRRMRDDADDADKEVVTFVAETILPLARQAGLRSKITDYFTRKIDRQSFMRDENDKRWRMQFNKLWTAEDDLNMATMLGQNASWTGEDQLGPLLMRLKEQYEVEQTLVTVDLTDPNAEEFVESLLERIRARKLADLVEAHVEVKTVMMTTAQALHKTAVLKEERSSPVTSLSKCSTCFISSTGEDTK